jgi:hypothetical protein
VNRLRSFAHNASVRVSLAVIAIWLGLTVLWAPVAVWSQQPPGAATGVHVAAPLSGSAFVGGFYTTSFDLIENPISESGVWWNGQVDGRDWGDAQTANGRVYGTRVNGFPPYDDSEAVMKGTWDPDQYAQGHVFAQNQNIPGGLQEVELRLRRTLSTGVSTGYEVLYSCRTQNPYVQIVRWNGALNDYDVLAGVTGPGLVTGSLLKATIDGTTITAWQDGVALVQVIDATYATGNPGVGFYLASETTAQEGDCGFSDFEASNLVGGGYSYTAASCSRADVNAMINGPTHTAVNGDTIQIPAGSCTWTSGITVPSGVGITIMGAGTPSSDPALMGPSASCTQTQITLSGDLIGFTFATSYGNATARVSCMSIIYGASAHAVGIAATGTCTSSGCPNLRWDNLTFPNWTGHLANAAPVNSYGINAENGYFGLIDHNEVDGNLSDVYLELVEFGLTTYKGVGLYGDKDYEQAENYGGPDFLFFENNLLTGGAGFTETETNVVDYGGGRVVARYNSVPHGDGNAVLVWHGTESSGRKRSPHAFEYYNNTYTCDAGNQCAQVIGIRGGSGIAWGNSVTMGTGANMNQFMSSVDYRTQGTPSNKWGPCDGSSPYDTNDGTTYYSDTIAGVSGSAPTWTVTTTGSPGWTTNQWLSVGSPYSLHDVTASSGAVISGNGANTLTLYATGGPGSYVPTIGHSIQILRATVCLDQLGRTGGTLYSTDPAESTAANQALVPYYQWLTTKTGGNAFIWADAGGIGTAGDGVNASNSHLLINRDYYRETLNQAAQTTSSSPFSGASGMGHGTLALIPTTCTAGVAYWATDTNGLYKCTATNTWRWIYSPYTYPHPNVGALPLNNYATSFPLTESPIHEGNTAYTTVWTGGQYAGSNLWGDVQTSQTNGPLVYGVSIPTLYGDATGLLRGTWGANQGAQATVGINSGGPASQGEVEIRLRSSISLATNTGYEFYCSVISTNAYCHIATWAGPNGQYCNIAGSASYLQNGDTLSATVSGANPAVLKLYINGVVNLTFSDTGINHPTTDGTRCGVVGNPVGPWTSGSPGVGFWRGDNTGLSRFGFSRFSAVGQ